MCLKRQLPPVVANKFSSCPTALAPTPSALQRSYQRDSLQQMRRLQPACAALTVASASCPFGGQAPIPTGSPARREAAG